MWIGMEYNIKKTRRNIIGRGKRKRIQYTLRTENMNSSVGQVYVYTVLCAFKHFSLHQSVLTLMIFLPCYSYM